MEDWISVYKSSAPPFPTALMAGSYNMSLDRVISKDVSYGPFYCAIEDDQCEWWMSDKEILKVAEAVVESISSDPEVINRAEREFEKSSLQLLTLLDKQKLVKNLPDMGLKEISDLLKTATLLYQQATYWPEPANFALEIKGHELIRGKFLDYLNSKGAVFSSSELSELFAILSNPTKTSFIMKAELSLLQIALLSDKQQVNEAVQKHADEFYWLEYDYYGPVLTSDKVKEELESYRGLSKEEINSRIDSILSYENESEARLKEALARVNINTELNNLFLGVRKFAYFYSDYKKMQISKASLDLGLIIREISDRLGVDETELHFATVRELTDILSGKEIDKSVFGKRRKKSLLQVKNTIYDFIDRKVQFRLQSKIVNYSGMIKGMSACSGFYTGKARVVSNPRVVDFEIGDVLVTEMTSVDFIPLMKKAGAIVTNLGGITSHAAIVSRELNIPCVIGTGNATVLIKDGDIVQVNARHGIIKIVKG